MGNLSALIGVFVFAAAAQGCSSKTCPTIGCSDQFTATVQRADGSFPSGAHRIEILADGVMTTCSFSYPLATAPGGGGTAPSCPSGMMVTVGQQEVCTQTTVNNSVATTCQPVPGQVRETIQISGAPGQVHAWQYVDDVAALDTAAAPSYQDVAPNGKECGPICRQASVAWTLN
jgi:hypothetical protein